MASQSFVCLDVGEKRIGVAIADSSVRIAIPFMTIEVDGDEIEAIAEIVLKEEAKTIVVGYPRNQQGEPTTQTDYVEKFVEKLQDIEAEIIYQDESLTSVMAEQQLIAHKKPYVKGDIDALAAAIILQDYLEVNHG